MTVSTEINHQLKVYIHGLTGGNRDSRDEAYVSLYRHGKSAIPALKAMLLSNNFTGINPGLEISILSGLLTLLNDIDETEANHVGQILKNHGCSQTIKTRITSILRFSITNYSIYSVNGIKILMQNSLKNQKSIMQKVRKWLSHIEEKHLEGIERIYITSESNNDYRGTYQPVYNNITVEWDNDLSFFNPFSFFLTMRIEHTLYHEIGHHSLRHNAGQNEIQENEANQFAKNLIGKSHPIMTKIVKLSKDVFRRN